MVQPPRQTPGPAEQLAEAFWFGVILVVTMWSIVALHTLR